LFIIPMLPVMAKGPSSQMTVKAPVSGAQGPPVLRETTSFRVPGSLPWQALATEPMVAELVPATFVRSGESAIPSPTLPIVGYGIGTGDGAIGVMQTLTAMPTIWWPDFSV